MSKKTRLSLIVCFFCAFIKPSCAITESSENINDLASPLAGSYWKDPINHYLIHVEEDTDLIIYQVIVKDAYELLHLRHGDKRHKNLLNSLEKDPNHIKFDLPENNYLSFKRMKNNSITSYAYHKK